MEWLKSLVRKSISPFRIQRQLDSFRIDTQVSLEGMLAQIRSVADDLSDVAERRLNSLDTEMGSVVNDLGSVVNDLESVVSGPLGKFGKCEQGATYAGVRNQTCGGDAGTWGETSMEMWYRADAKAAGRQRYSYR